MASCCPGDGICHPMPLHSYGPDFCTTKGGCIPSTTPSPKLMTVCYRNQMVSLCAVQEKIELSCMSQRARLSSTNISRDLSLATKM